MGSKMKKWVFNPMCISLQVREALLKKWVVRLVEFSLGERNVENLIPKVPNYSYKALRIHVFPVFESLEGKWGN
jgi:hypothetical protein